MTEEKYPFRFKTVLFGNEGVGKTALVERFVNNVFKEEYITTLGYQIYQKTIEYKNFEIGLVIFDIGGQKQYDMLREQYAAGANNAFLVYDVTDATSFERIIEWKKDLDEYSRNIPFVMIGNKIDLESERQVSTESAEKMANQLEAIKFFETSAKTGEGVENAFEELAILTLKSVINMTSFQT